MSGRSEKKCGSRSAMERWRFRYFFPFAIFHRPASDLLYGSLRFTILALFCPFVSLIPACSRKFSAILAFSHINNCALNPGRTQSSGAQHAAWSHSLVAEKQSSFAWIAVLMERNPIPCPSLLRGSAALRELIPFFHWVVLCIKPARHIVDTHRTHSKHAL
jgi:hypothetical protein